jgi:hypothetical protein
MPLFLESAREHITTSSSPSAHTQKNKKLCINVMLKKLMVVVPTQIFLCLWNTGFYFGICTFTLCGWISLTDSRAARKSSASQIWNRDCKDASTLPLLLCESPPYLVAFLEINSPQTHVTQQIYIESIHHCNIFWWREWMIHIKGISKIWKTFLSVGCSYFAPLLLQCLTSQNTCEALELENDQQIHAQSLFAGHTSLFCNKENGILDVYTSLFCKPKREMFRG